MTNLHRFVGLLAALMPIAGGCNSVLGIDDHLGPGGAGGATGTGGTAGGFTCSADAGVDDGDATNCAFIMPNPESSTDLPNRASYTVNVVDGSLTDNVTGLTWEGTSRFTVSMLGQASSACDGSRGWRLPTRLELTSLVDFTIPTPGPAINRAFANDPIWANTSGPDDKKFWTASHAVMDATVGWYVDFAIGSTHQENDKSKAYKVRCVRDGTFQCPPTRYQVAGDGTVHDGATGLTWRRDVAPMANWSDANAFCPNVGAGWRLPSLTEMQTIVDETQEKPAIDRVAFPCTPPLGYFWTSSQNASDSGSAWYVTVIHGHSNPEPATTPYFVRCVRWDGL